MKINNLAAFCVAAAGPPSYWGLRTTQELTSGL